MVFYQDKEILPSNKDVLLSGGYSGHANFGDVAQLKSVISWYKEHGFEPIVIIRLDSIYDDGFVKKLYEWFDVKGFLYYSTRHYDVSKYSLKECHEFKCDKFHLYGGGMINRFWAKDIISLNESIIDHFKVKEYILSGQQIDAVGAKLLVDHFKVYPATLIGVRDMESLTHLKENYIEAYYSFDDAYEELKRLSKEFVIQKREQQEIYLHLNLSAYVSDNLKDVVKDYVEKLEYLKLRYPDAKYKLLLTYLDSQILSVMDTMSVVGALDYHFDLRDVEILNLASMSLQNSSKTQLSSDAIVLATSYHTAMFFQLMNFRVFMFAGNDYYEQKRSGLLLDERDLEKVINGEAVDLSASRDKSRAEWFEKLGSLSGECRISEHKFITNVESKSMPVFDSKPIHTNIQEFLAQLNRAKQSDRLSKKVFGIGWAKTGTTTLGEVAAILGYRHKSQDMALVDDAMKGDFTRIKRFVSDYESFEDWPWLIIYKQLDMICESSKFILTVRDTDAWIKSYRNMLKNEGVASEYTNRIRSFLYGLDFPNVTDEELIRRYEYHIREVKEYFKHRPNDLLVVDWTKGDGWSKVCEFLGKEVPMQEFPHKNKGSYK